MTDNEEKIVRNVLIYNGFLILSISVITLAGAWLTGTMWGLVSLLLLTCLGTFKTKS